MINLFLTVFNKAQMLIDYSGNKFNSVGYIDQGVEFPAANIVHQAVDSLCRSPVKTLAGFIEDNHRGKFYQRPANQCKTALTE